jgi:excinuclease ABC subunit A
LDEPSAGLHPTDTRALLEALHKLKHSGNSLIVVEHDLDIVRNAEWIVDVGPGAGQGGGCVLYSGPLQGLAAVAESATARYLHHGVPPLNAATTEGMAHSEEHFAQQSARNRCRCSRRRAYGGDRRIGCG